MSRQHYYHGDQRKYGNEKAKRVVDAKVERLQRNLKEFWRLKDAQVAAEKEA